MGAGEILVGPHCCLGVARRGASRRTVCPAHQSGVGLGSTLAPGLVHLAADLPRERDQVQTKLLPRYGQLRAEVFELIQEAKRPVTQSIGAVRA